MSSRFGLGRRWLIVAGIVALVVGVGAWVFLNVGKWLVVEDPLQPADAIVVLSGAMPIRAEEAARIYRQNVSARVWVSQGLSPAAELRKMHINFLGEDFYSQEVLLALGVPADAIHILEEPAGNTLEEVDEIARDVRRDKGNAVIIVTSKPHTRRVRAVWKRRVGNTPRLMVRYPSDDPFDAAHWWRHTQDALNVVRELLGLANAWLGFPVRAGAH